MLKVLKSFIMISLMSFSMAFAVEVKEIAAKCADCHGPDGLSTENDIPILAGQSNILIEDALIAFAENERPCKESKFRDGDVSRPATTMCKIAARLSEDVIEELGQHYANLPFVAVKQDFDPALIEKGALIHERNCEKCHSEGGSLADDDAGILAGQWTPYLRSSIKKFLAEQRPMADKMAVKIKRLDEEDFEALFNFYASKAK